MQVGVKGTDVIVLAVEKKSTAKLQEARTVRKIHVLDSHLCLGALYGFPFCIAPWHLRSGLDWMCRVTPHGCKASPGANLREGRAQSRCRCGKCEPGSGADVGAVCPWIVRLQRSPALLPMRVF